MRLRAGHNSIRGVDGLGLTNGIAAMCVADGELDFVAYHTNANILSLPQHDCPNIYIYIDQIDPN